jgi:hypothetical protein
MGGDDGRFFEYLLPAGEYQKQCQEECVMKTRTKRTRNFIVTLSLLLTAWLALPLFPPPLSLKRR